ncbi:endonuclease/exonuclease/phosphatase family protein [soil metagenome]
MSSNRLSVRTKVLRVLAWVFALPAGLGGLGSMGGAFSEQLDLLANLTPLWLACGLIGAVLWLSAGRRGAALPALCLIGVSVGAFLMAPEFIAAAKPKYKPSPNAEIYKILQFNVWEGNRDSAGTAAYIRTTGADIVMMEENSYGAATIPDRLKDIYPYQIHCGQQSGRPCGVTVLFKHKPDRGGGQGPPPAVWTTNQLPKTTHWFEAVALHNLWPTNPYQAVQRRTMSGRVSGSAKGAIIVGGDYNMTPWSWAMRRQDKAYGMERRTRAVFSWPARFDRFALAPFPFLPIDHVYAGAEWKIVSIERGPRTGSDHYPVLVTLAYEGGPPPYKPEPMPPP